MAKKITKKLQFNKNTIERIIQRDQSCIFCDMCYHMESKDDYAYHIYDIMHIVPKSSLGLGVERNGVFGCRYHHSLFDNGNMGLHSEMMEFIEKYMKTKYPDWDKKDLVYKKYEW